MRALSLLQAGKVDELTQADRDYVATNGYVKLQNGQPQILPRGTRRLRALLPGRACFLASLPLARMPRAFGRHKDASPGRRVNVG